MEVQPYDSDQANLHFFVNHGITRLTQLNFLFLTIAGPSESLSKEIKWTLKKLC